MKKLLLVTALSVFSFLSATSAFAQEVSVATDSCKSIQMGKIQERVKRDMKFCGKDKNGHQLYGSEVCGWASVPICAAAGLAGFLPGLACAATTMWGCTYHCDY